MKELELPPAFAGLLQAQIDVMNYESWRALASERVHHFPMLSETLQKLLDTAGKTDVATYDRARALASACRGALDGLMGEADVLLVPSAPGEAPIGLSATGNPVFNRIWTLLGVPCVTVPGAKGPNGMPVGVQLVGRFGDDARTLAAADWLQPRLAPG